MKSPGEEEDSKGRFRLSVAESFEPVVQALARIRAMPVEIGHRIASVMAASLGKPVILVVDDDEGIQVAWRSNLRRRAEENPAEAVDCLVVGTAEDALRIIETADRIDVLVVDHLLRDQTGLAVVGEFRLKFGSALVVVSSGLDTDEIREAYKRMGSPVEFSPKRIADERVMTATKKTPFPR